MYVYAGTYILVMGLLFKLFAVSSSVSGKVDNYAENVDKCLDLALKGIEIQDCIENQDYSQDINDLNEVVNDTMSLNSKLYKQLEKEYGIDILSLDSLKMSLNDSEIEELSRILG